MHKELIISAIVVICIIIANFIIGNFIDDKLNNVTGKLNKIRVAIEENNYEEADKLKDELEDYWDKSEKVLSCYIEHDELEKVETEFTSFKACLKIKEEDSIEYLDRMVFTIEHIEKKDDLVLENIF